MNISEFTARLVLLFLPGIVCVLIVDALTVHRERKPFQFVVHAFIFGAVSYAMSALVWWFNSLFDPVITLEWWPRRLTILQALINTQQTPSVAEVGLATLCALPVALFASFGVNRGLFHRIAGKFSLTNKFGQIDVWGFTFNSPDVVWVVVRDLKNDLAYSGWLRAFSEAEDPREVLLKDVRVFRNSSGERLYDVDALYVSRKKEDWTVELPTTTDYNFGGS